MPLGRPVREREARAAADGEPLAASAAVQRIWTEQARRDTWRVRAGAFGFLTLLAATMLWAARAQFLPGLNPQHVLDIYTPGIQLGRALTDEQLSAFDFEIGSDLGYVNARAAVRDGLTLQRVRILGVQPRGPRIPTWGSVAEVDLTTSDRRIADRVESRLRAALGRPSVGCTKDGERFVSWGAGTRGATVLDESRTAGSFAAELRVGPYVSAPREGRTTRCR